MLTSAPEFPYLKPNDWYGKMFQAIGNCYLATIL